MSSRSKQQSLRPICRSVVHSPWRHSPVCVWKPCRLLSPSLGRLSASMSTRVVKEPTRAASKCEQGERFPKLMESLGTPFPRCTWFLRTKLRRTEVPCGGRADPWDCHHHYCHRQNRAEWFQSTCLLKRWEG